ncbi:hypothetical protein MUK42_07977 [Musa troglodytarum]|uniref:Uncharacterized protein n=1 Tax=Musa troglodytarum TaxID=320322 RepID=A0A9E7HPA9_9LILI|nr:hypothetical protein MUK42_07977 [Musa troglodytarum]
MSEEKRRQESKGEKTDFFVSPRSSEQITPFGLTWLRNEDRGICVGFSGIGVKRVIMSPYMPRRSDLSMTPDILSLRSLLTIKRILDGNNIHGDCLPISKEQVFVFSYYWFWNSAPPSAVRALTELFEC